MTPHGWYWEVVHKDSGEVVNSGYSRVFMEQTTNIPRLKGFVLRSVPMVSLDDVRSAVLGVSGDSAADAPDVAQYDRASYIAGYQDALVDIDENIRRTK